jgi:DNA recombination-dependent growth factor C
MGIISGALTGARFRVEGDLPGGWRETFRDRLNDLAFRDPQERLGKEEVLGWVLTQNLLDTDFTDFNKWLYGDWALIALRTDKKKLPARLFRATLEKRCEAWGRERGVERVPNTVKTELKERLEEEWLARALPSVAVTEAVWNVQTGVLLLGALSEKPIDAFRKRFFQTFGLKLTPWSPLDWLASRGDVERLLARVPSELTAAGGA